MYTACDNELDGKPFYGVIITDRNTGNRLCNEVSKEYKFWNMWNDKGYNGYFCPEPMTAMINCANLSLDPEISGYREISNGETFECWQRFFTL
jgi:aldose 1-epimerase